MAEAGRARPRWRVVIAGPLHVLAMAPNLALGPTRHNVARAWDGAWARAVVGVPADAGRAHRAGKGDIPENNAGDGALREASDGLGLELELELGLGLGLG